MIARSRRPSCTRRSQVSMRPSRCCTTGSTRAFLDAAGPQLRCVANVAVGYDNIDVAACSERGVLVTNTPGVLTDATADLAIALMLSVTRRLGEGERLLRARDAVVLAHVLHARHRTRRQDARRDRSRRDRAGDRAPRTGVRNGDRRTPAATARRRPSSRSWVEPATFRLTNCSPPRTSSASTAR